MVWFQCEDCGENLKKPKLVHHFRACSAQQLSCIDCGVVFNQQSVQGHTQCVSEAEKYGPKITGSIKKETMKSLSKEPNCDGMDISLGLSTRAPWSCRLCNVKATSQETLALHSQGKKHRSKVRAMSSKQLNGHPISNNGSGAIGTVSSVDRNLDVNGHTFTVSSSNGLCENSTHKSKRKDGCSSKAFFQPEDGSRQHKDADSDIHLEPSAGFPGGDNKEQTERQQKRSKIDVEQDQLLSCVRREPEQSCNQTEARFLLTGVKLSKIELVDCGKHLEDRAKRKQKKHLAGEDVVQKWSSLVKWKKVIKRTLRNAPNGSLKIKRLRSSLLPAVMEVAQNCGFEVSKESFLRELEKQIQSHAMFTIDGKTVRLAVKDMDKEHALA